MANNLTQRQDKFVTNIIAGMSPLEAYKNAGYATNMTNAKLSVQANKLSKVPKISHIIAEHKEKVREQAGWSRQRSIDTLMEIASKAMEHATTEVTNKDGEVIDVKYNSNAQGVAIKAVEQLNKVLGYNEPDKVDMDIKVDFAIPRPKK